MKGRKEGGEKKIEIKHEIKHRKDVCATRCEYKYFILPYARRLFGSDRVLDESSEYSSLAESADKYGD